MLCEICKVREADVLYTEIIDGIKTEHHFCSTCAKEMDFGQYSSIFDGDFPLTKILSGILSTRESLKKSEAEYKRIICPSCKTSYEDFINNAKFGCKDCYEVFDILISDNIKQLQGGLLHTGKKPKRHEDEKSISYTETVLEDEKSMQLTELKNKLKQAIDFENYEQAAVLRDEIKKLKGEI